MKRFFWKSIIPNASNEVSRNCAHERKETPSSMTPIVICFIPLGNVFPLLPSLAIAPLSINQLFYKSQIIQEMSKEQKKKTHPLQHLIGGGIAGLAESSVCHPLDTLKTRMQLRRQAAPSVEQVVVKMRDSLMEPALRLQHSLRDPSYKPPTMVQSNGTAVLSPPSEANSWKRASPHALHTTVVIKPPKAAHMSNSTTVSAPLGPIGTAQRIIQREGFFALYKGLTAVYAGIIPKMAIRFVSFEQYREWGLAWVSRSSMDISPTTVTFTAGLASGLTEAILVVTPAEVCKIRMQSQYHSLMDPTQMQHRKYTNVLQTAVVIVREEGLGALYKGVVPTMLRQGCNQAVNFTAYNVMKTKLMDWQGTTELAAWQSLALGGFSGGMGPLVNNPLDVIKTRLQKQVVVPGRPPKYTGLLSGMAVVAREEGVLALWKGITPRLLRIVPGQAITFMTYEAVSAQMHRMGWFAMA
jgi:solute carrier family 25 (mitochondrial citrate transporter), member 1